MRLTTSTCWRVGLSAVFGVLVFLFWAVVYPHALSYQEQYELFLWSADYFVERTCVPGGLADWLGEFVVQFYYTPWLGALLLALVFVAWQRLVGLIPAVLLLWAMSDPSVLLGYAFAVLMAVGVADAVNAADRRLGGARAFRLADVVIVPLVYWATGPLAWLYVALRIAGCGWRHAWTVLLLAASQVAVYSLLLTQWPLVTVLLPMLYYRIPLHLPMLMWLIPIVILALRLLGRLLPSRPRVRTGWAVAEVVVGAALAWTGLQGYDREMYELIREDYLVRNERWDEVIERARQFQVHTAFSSVCVNLALGKTGQLADRMFDFYQSGEDALIMPRIRDLTSMLPTAEAFWHLGMVNSSQRYMFDTQESILNGKKSGRCTKRIAECMIVNGHYDVAAKQLDLLDRTLYYRHWAAEARRLLGHDERVEAHPVYGRQRQLRYRENYLFSYSEIDKMLGLLFMNNQSNRMALDYFMGQLLLKGELQGFQQYMPWVQQYGGYQRMPLGYQDAMLCIQRQGAVAGSPYASYAKRMMAERGKR